jgi:hypothetical protein
MKLMISDGVRKDNTEHYVFDNNEDLDNDVIYLTNSHGGEIVTDNLTYYYAYEFNPKSNIRSQREFRDALKHSFSNKNVFYGGDAIKFVENGFSRLSDMKSLEDFGVVISTASRYGEQTLTGLMCRVCYENMPNHVQCGNMQLIKKMCKDVTFDEDRARAALSKTKRYSDPDDMEDAIQSLKDQFETAKKEGNPFQIKRYIPVVGRAGFIDFFKFATPAHRNAYEKLAAGTEVLICDDFITSGSTVREIIRFLNSINPNNKITVFVLVNQLRSY